jgi:hypothetical protein
VFGMLAKSRKALFLSILFPLGRLKIEICAMNKALCASRLVFSELLSVVCLEGSLGSVAFPSLLPLRGGRHIRKDIE